MTDDSRWGGLRSVRLAALIRRQAHQRKREEQREYFEEIRTAVATFDP
ncbi:MAG: hypothetical protein J2P54_24105 [Bradyrhizobiaceae bacterium]|nr:hypothetical protein [Bradyrhizobiaceae bacterium]